MTTERIPRDDSVCLPTAASFRRRRATFDGEAGAAADPTTAPVEDFRFGQVQFHTGALMSMCVCVSRHAHRSLARFLVQRSYLHDGCSAEVGLAQRNELRLTYVHLSHKITVDAPGASRLGHIWALAFDWMRSHF